MDLFGVQSTAGASNMHTHRMSEIRLIVSTVVFAILLAVLEILFYGFGSLATVKGIAYVLLQTLAFFLLMLWIRRAGDDADSKED